MHMNAIGKRATDAVYFLKVVYPVTEKHAHDKILDILENADFQHIFMFIY